MSVEAEKAEARTSVKDTIRVIIHALILALLVRIFLFQPFNIPSGSMIPTLLIGDYLFVSKYSYGYSRYSFPFGLNLFSGRVWAKEPDRGDVVVFKLPRDNETDYIKRVIGLPGDEIQMIHGVLNINGKPVPKVKIDDFVVTDDSGRARHMARYKETLPNGVSYPVLDLVEDGFGDNTEVYKVPEGHFFMMGEIATTRLTAASCLRWASCRSRIWSARRRSSSSRSTTTRGASGRCGIGRRAFAGRASSMWWIELA
jgi:signal peptidase I